MCVKYWCIFTKDGIQIQDPITFEPLRFPSELVAKKYIEVARLKDVEVVAQF